MAVRRFTLVGGPVDGQMVALPADRYASYVVAEMPPMPRIQHEPPVEAALDVRTHTYLPMPIGGGISVLALVGMTLHDVLHRLVEGYQGWKDDEE